MITLKSTSILKVKLGGAPGTEADWYVAYSNSAGKSLGIEKGVTNSTTDVTILSKATFGLVHAEYVSVYNADSSAITATITLADNGTDRILAVESIAAGETLVYSDGRWGEAILSTVDTAGTPADDQIAVFTDADTVEGTSGLTYDGSVLDVSGNIELDGDLLFTSTGKGLVCGEISVVNNTTDTTISVAGTKYQVTVFDTDGCANGTTPAHGTDDITIATAGVYFIAVSATVNSVGGGGSRFELEVRKNNGATAVGALHCDRNMAGGGATSGVISMSGIAVLAASDTIEVWIENETGTENYRVEDMTLSLFKIGG